MTGVDPAYLIWAVLPGGISAISLPLGSAAGLAFRPRAPVSATLAAFGAGALIAALSVELLSARGGQVSTASFSWGSRNK